MQKNITGVFVCCFNGNSNLFYILHVKEETTEEIETERNEDFDRSQLV